MQIPPTEQTPLITHAQTMLAKTKGLNKKCRAFLEYFTGKFGVEKPSKKLEKWHELDFAEFCLEIGKKGRKLTATEEFEFSLLFNTQKQECIKLQNQITKTDTEIDRMVYKLYGLTQEEIEVIEK